MNLCHCHSARRSWRRDASRQMGDDDPALDEVPQRPMEDRGTRDRRDARKVGSKDLEHGHLAHAHQHDLRFRPAHIALPNQPDCLYTKYPMTSRLTAPPRNSLQRAAYQVNTCRSLGFSGIPLKDRCFSFIMKNCTSASHVRRPMGPRIIARGSSNLYVSRCV